MPEGTEKAVGTEEKELKPSTRRRSTDMTKAVPNEPSFKDAFRLFASVSDLVARIEKVSAVVDGANISELKNIGLADKVVTDLNNTLELVKGVAGVVQLGGETIQNSQAELRRGLDELPKTDFYNIESRAEFIQGQVATIAKSCEATDKRVEAMTEVMTGLVDIVGKLQAAQAQAEKPPEKPQEAPEATNG